MAIEFNREAYTKVFNDLDAYRDYCRFEGKVFNEKALYNKQDQNWQAYQRYQNYLRMKNRNQTRKNYNGKR